MARTRLSRRGVARVHVRIGRGDTVAGPVTLAESGAVNELFAIVLVLAGSYITAYAVATVVVAVMDALGLVYSTEREARKAAREAAPTLTSAARHRETRRSS